MAEVFVAHDLTEDRDVAVKIVRSSEPGLAQRLALEAKALARLKHPGLVRFLDAGVHRDQAYLVMELVEGPTLAARLRRGPLSPARTAVLGRTIAEALAFVHGRGIVHRDVKPANVLLGPGSRARLADFGIARLADASSLTVTGTTLGTAAYMAPEQIEHHAVGPAADVWSLGVILLECLTGRRVFEGTATEVVARRLAGPVPLPPDLPAPWRLLFEGMLVTEPDRRPSATQVAGMLSAEPFFEPWDRAGDQTAAASEVDGGAGAAGPAGGGNGASAGAAATRLANPITDDGRGGTLVAPAARPAPEHREPPRSRRLSPWLLIVALVVLAAAGITAWRLDANSTPHTSNRTHSTTTTVPATTTTSSTTTTTSATTTTPTTGSAAATLLADIQTGVSDGSVSSSAARSLRGDLNQALTASQNGDQNQVSQSVDAMDGTINNEVQNGSMSPSESSKLFADVGNLANALGVSSSPSSGGSGSTTTSSTSGNTGAGNTGTGNTGAGGHGAH
jgi:eukaryotic-like serine/threonine-protein kinase